MEISARILMDHKKLRRINILPPGMVRKEEKNVPAVAKKLKKAFQINTYNDLCASKVIVHSRPEIIKHLDKVVKATEEYRAGLAIETLSLTGWKKKVSKREMQENMSITVIDENRLPMYGKIFLSKEGISIKNLNNFVDCVIRGHKKDQQKQQDERNK
jgi:hypothetical protein